MLIGVFVLILLLIPAGWFAYTAYGYFKAIRAGEIVTPEDLRINSSIADVAANADVTNEDLRRLKPNGLAPELGSRTARISIVEFVDYQCPFCARTAPAIRRVMYEMGDRVHFMIRDYPVLDPSKSRTAALAANCVLEQGQDEYWKFSDTLFTDISKSSSVDLREVAFQSGANLSAYDKCMEERRYDLKIDNDIEVGKQAGVEGTPTFFVNRVKIQGELDDKLLTRIINTFLESLPQ
jgi:protein-disulfide isomerase